MCWSLRRFDMKKALFALILLALLPTEAFCVERIVILYAAASPIVKALGVPEAHVVGVTRTDHEFPQAVRVGSHLRPNLELIKALKPDFIICGSKRAFPYEAARRFKARVFRYDPRSLEEILASIERLGHLLGREKEAKALAGKLSEKLRQVRPLPRRPGVVYEVMSVQLKVAGEKSIVSDIIWHAGGRNLVKVPKKHVQISPEKVLSLAPDFYIYQVGPMNRRPTPPKERPYFRALKSVVVKVDEKEFARPGLNAFDAVLELNKVFYEHMKK